MSLTAAKDISIDAAAAAVASSEPAVFFFFFDKHSKRKKMALKTFLASRYGTMMWLKKTILFCRLFNWLRQPEFFMDSTTNEPSSGVKEDAGVMEQKKRSGEVVTAPN